MQETECFFVDYEKKQYLCTQKVTDMEGNMQNESLLRVAHELAQMGQKSGRALTEGEILPVLEQSLPMIRPEVTEVRPQALECDVVRFQNNKEKWVALVGLLDGYPYEIFTGLQDDEEGIILPKTVTHGKIIKQVNPDGTKRYDFQFENKRGYKTTVEGLSEKFNPEYWNYAKLISGVLRYRMPLEHVIKLVASLSLKDESINTWKTGVERALKKYIPGVADDEELRSEE
jgi:ribonucleoside-diphosphate reductase alpha chain